MQYAKIIVPILRLPPTLAQAPSAESRTNGGTGFGLFLAPDGYSVLISNVHYRRFRPSLWMVN